MKAALILAASLLVSVSAAHAQTGFTVQTSTIPGSSLVTADFNGDGRPDLLSFSGSSNGEVALNDSGSQGPYSTSVVLPGGIALTDAKVADLNGDNHPDIVGCGQLSNGSYVLVSYLNNGSGTFTVAQTNALTGRCSGVVVGDVNRDGKVDVVTASFTPSSSSTPYANTLQTWLGNGNGSFDAPITTSNVNVDDTTGDPTNTNCYIDNIAGGNFFTDNNVSIVLNAQCYPQNGNTRVAHATSFIGHGFGDGHFTLTQMTGVPGGWLKTNLVADIDRDGNPDLLTVRSAVYPGASLYYAHNNGGGQFTFTEITTSIAPDVGQTLFVDSLSATLGDVNGDGIPDLITGFRAENNTASTSSYVGIAYGANGGTFTPSQHWLLGDVSSIAAAGLVTADFNVDGKIDVIVHTYKESTRTEGLYLYRNTPGQNSCAVPAEVNSSLFCTPAQGSSVPSPVKITAASNVQYITLNRLYLDGAVIYETTDQSIAIQPAMSLGAHHLVLVTYNTSGQSRTVATDFTVVDACLPGSAGVQICSPTPGTTDASPVTVKAGAVASSGFITALRVYVDDIAVATVLNPSQTESFQMDQAIEMNAGTHRMVVVGYESTGDAVTSAVQFTVTPGAGNCFPTAPGATICSPVNNASVSSPVSITSGATAANGFITAIRIYVDDVAQVLVNNPQQTLSFGTTQAVAMPAGSHHVVVVGYQSDGGAVTAGELLTVQ